MKNAVKIYTLLFISILAFCGITLGGECDNLNYLPLCNNCEDDCIKMYGVENYVAVADCKQNCETQYCELWQIHSGEYEECRRRVLDNLSGWRANCTGIANVITEDNMMYLTDNCCFKGGNVIPQCACNNQPQNGECQSGFKLENYCCVRDCSSVGNTGCKTGQTRSTGTCSCECDPSKGCCGVQLNVPLPFIGDCIEMTTNNSIAGDRDGSISVNQLNAFPVLIKGISKIVVTLIMIFSIIVVICAGIMMTTSVASQGNFNKGLDMLKKVIVALILLGVSGLILRLINPSFFGG